MLLNIKSLFKALLLTALIISNAAYSQQKPNIIFILTDDLGYGDLGVFFQKQRQLKNSRSEPFMFTPNLDKMAAEGAVMEQYCAAPVCAPSRASLLLGVSQGHANVRDNQFDKALENNYTLGNVMQKAGYKTATIGKWGLQGEKSMGPNWPASPLKRGFDYYYGYIAHGDGHEHYPKEGVYRKPKQLWDNTTEISNSLDKCYTGDLFTAVAKRYIVDHKKGKDASKPFFMYLAFDTPHAALELPTIAYPKGGGLKGGLQWLGKPGQMINTAVGKPDSWIHPNYANATYDDDKNAVTPEVPWPDTYKRYATSVQRIDDQVGDIIQLLKDLKIDENTLIVFSSDNGPSAESYLPKEYVDNTPNFFNGFGPFDGIKRDVLEGGVRVPVIAYWPKHIKAKTKITQPSISYDWMPTFTAAAGLPAPARADGVSLLPSLTGTGKQQESLVYVEYEQSKSKTPAYEEFERNRHNRPRNHMQMLRMGDTLGLRYDIKSNNDDFEIYDIVNDPKQTTNLAGKVSATLQEKMKSRILQIRRPDASATRPYDNELIPSINTANVSSGLNWKSYRGKYPWLAKIDAFNATSSGVINSLDLSKLKKLSSDGTYLIQGYLQIPEDGMYTFFLNAAGKAFIRLHDIALIDADFEYKGEEKQAKVLLKKGAHPIKVYYSPSYINKPAIDLKWETASIAKQSVPAMNFLK